MMRKRRQGKQGMGKAWQQGKQGMGKAWRQGKQGMGKAWLAGSSRGELTDVLTVCIFVLVLTIVMFAYVGSVQIFQCKAQIGQIARKYILRMETVGCLTNDDRLAMEQELHQIGAKSVDFSGTTLSAVEFGSPIYLVVHGEIEAQNIVVGSNLFQTAFGTAVYRFEDRKMSTAKN